MSVKGFSQKSKDSITISYKALDKAILHKRACDSLKERYKDKDALLQKYMEKDSLSDAKLKEEQQKNFLLQRELEDIHKRAKGKKIKRFSIIGGGFIDFKGQPYFGFGVGYTVFRF